MIQVIGDKEILKAIIGLPRHLSDPYLKKVHTKAAVPLVNRIHLNAPVGLTGDLADSIGTVKTSELGGTATGPRVKGGYKGFAGHLNEYGTKRRRTRRGANRGVMPKKPFEAPAWEQTQDQVERIIAETLEKDLGSYFRSRL